MGHRKQRVVRELGLQGGADLQLLHGLGGRAAELAADGAVTDKMDGDLSQIIHKIRGQMAVCHDLCLLPFHHCGRYRIVKIKVHKYVEG